jgi:hypothetical protein
LPSSPNTITSIGSIRIRLSPAATVNRKPKAASLPAIRSVTSSHSRSTFSALASPE